MLVAEDGQQQQMGDTQYRVMYPRYYNFLPADVPVALSGVGKTQPDYPPGGRPRHQHGQQRGY